MYLSGYIYVEFLILCFHYVHLAKQRADFGTNLASPGSNLTFDTSTTTDLDMETEPFVYESAQANKTIKKTTSTCWWLKEYGFSGSSENQHKLN